MFKKFIPLICLLLLLVPSTTIAIDEDDDSTSGKIAYIGEDYNVYSYDVSSEARSALTTDASRTRRYQWTTWANDGRLAYFCCDLRVTQDLSSTAYISPDGITEGELAYTGESETVIYAAWSPADCTDGAGCRELAMLINNVQSGVLSVEMLKNAPEQTSNRTIDTGSPFYYHWNPQGTQLVFHRFNQQIDIYDIAASDISLAYDVPSSGTYQTPVWSPTDNRVLFGIEGENNTTDLITLADGEQQTLVSNLDGFVSFLWSPDGQYVAYRTLQQGNIGAVVVVDATTGQEITRSLVDDVFVFLWSPDSSKIAFITPKTDRNSAKVDGLASPLLQQDIQQYNWSVLNVTTGETIRYPYDFTPTYEMNYLMAYFDQFSPSHRLWSPDSRFIVFSQITGIENNEIKGIISTLDTDIPGQQPREIAEGVFAVWSFN